MSADVTCRFEELGDGVLAVALRPELNEVPWTDIERIGSGIVDNVANRARPRVLVDLTELTQMGSAIVAMVVRIWKTVKEREGRMIVVNRNAVVGEVLEISGLAGRWTIVSDRSLALDEFGRGDRSASGLLRGNSTGGIALTAVSAALAVLAVLALADAAFHGLAARSLGRVVLLGIGIACAAAGLVVGLIAAAQTFERLRLAAATLAVVSLAAVIAGFVLLTGLTQDETAVREASVAKRPANAVCQMEAGRFRTVARPVSARPVSVPLREIRRVAATDFP